MKIQAEDEYSIVTIVDKTSDVDATSAVKLCKRLLMGLDFHPDNITALMPDEHELDEIISNGINSEIVDNVKVSVDNDEGLTEYTGS
jgi:hypothetical protein